MTETEIKRRRFISKIECERDRQNEQHPKGMMDHGYPSRTLAMTVLAAEVGELADAILDKDREAQDKELTHIAAVCFRIYEEVL